MGIFHRLFSKKKPENQQVVGSEELMRLSALDSVIPVTAVHFVSAQSFYPLKKGAVKKQPKRKDLRGHKSAFGGFLSKKKNRMVFRI